MVSFGSGFGVAASEEGDVVFVFVAFDGGLIVGSSVGLIHSLEELV